MIGSAEISDCGRYRYRLTRYWRPGSTCVFIMLNPSTADADHDDRTIGRCINFAKREACGKLVVVNLYAWRDKSPRALFEAQDRGAPIIGPLNGIAIERAFREAKVIIAGWGANPRIKPRSRDIAAWAEATGYKLKCLGNTTSGAPQHPLYIKGDAPLRDWP